MTLTLSRWRYDQRYKAVLCDGSDGNTYGFRERRFSFGDDLRGALLFEACKKGFPVTITSGQWSDRGLHWIDRIERPSSSVGQTPESAEAR